MPDEDFLGESLRKISERDGKNKLYAYTSISFSISGA